MAELWFLHGELSDAPSVLHERHRKMKFAEEEEARFFSLNSLMHLSLTI